MRLFRLSFKEPSSFFPHMWDSVTIKDPAFHKIAAGASHIEIAKKGSKRNKTAP